MTQQETNFSSEFARKYKSSDKFKRQRLPACRPFLTPLGTVFIFSLISLISLGFSVMFYIHKIESFHLELEYSSHCKNERKCSINFEVNEDLNGPFYAYYQITNMYQNNYLFSSSIDFGQLTGKYPKEHLEMCAPMIKSGDDFFKTVYVPCGARTISVFNDTFQFSGFSEQMLEKGITDKMYKSLFKEPNAVYKQSINRWLENSEIFNGTLDEHFLNWIQASPFPKIMKLFGIWNTSAVLHKGVYTINIENNYPVSSFNGTKSVIIRKLNWYDGNYMFFFTFFIIITILSFISVVVFYIFYFLNLLPIYKALSTFNEQIQRSLL